MAAGVVVTHNGQPVSPWTETAKEFIVLTKFPHLRKRLEEGPHCLTRSERVQLELLADQRRSEVAASPTPLHSTLHDQVSLLVGGNLAHVTCDAVVNASNHWLTTGKGVNGALHTAAGPCLLEECLSLGVCEVGKAKITSGHALPVRHILHTVGPEGKDSDRAEKLRSCYLSCLSLCVEHNIRSVAFPCISTGAYSYPSVEAADVALTTCRQWLLAPENCRCIDRIVFVTRKTRDDEVYGVLMLALFPPPGLSSTER